jgi:integrase
MNIADHRRKVPVRPLLSEVEYLEATRAASTRREYANDVRLFIEAGGEIPATVDQIIAYVTDIGSRLSVSTIRRRLVSIHVTHLEQGFSSPVHDIRVKQLMKGVRRSLGVAQRQVSAIEKDILLDLWSAAAKRKPVWAARTIALLSTGWAGAFRRRELVGLTWDCITWLDSGIEILLRTSKVDQAGAGFMKFIPNAHGDRCPVKALKHWQEVSGLTSGPIFRSVGQNESIGDHALSTHSVANIIKQLIEASGRDPTLFSGHSLRAGYITAGILAGVQSHVLAMVSGHRGATLDKYVRIGNRRRQITSLL